MKFKVPGKPQGKARARVVNFGGRARAYTPEQTILYENYIKQCFLSAATPNDKELYEKPLHLQIIAVYGIPKGFSKVKEIQALNGELKPCVKPDIDNIAKVVCDALNGIAYKDDNQIVTLVVGKIYGIEPKLIISLKESI